MAKKGWEREGDEGNDDRKYRGESICNGVPEGRKEVINGVQPGIRTGHI